MADEQIQIWQIFVAVNNLLTLKFMLALCFFCCDNFALTPSLY